MSVTAMAFPPRFCERLIRMCCPTVSGPSMGVAVRRFAPLRSQRAQCFAPESMALSGSDDFAVDDVLELKFGSELQSIQFLGRVDSVPGPMARLICTFPGHGSGLRLRDRLAQPSGRRFSIRRHPRIPAKPILVLAWLTSAPSWSAPITRS